MNETIHVETIHVLSNLRIASEKRKKRKEAELRENLLRVLEKSYTQGGLFDGRDILFLSYQLNQVYPGVSRKEQERRVRKLLQKHIPPERACFYADIRR
jgi:hypothetical protein